MRNIFLVAFFSVLLSFFLCEGFVRILTHRGDYYDIEMTRYSSLLKKDSLNPLLVHTHHPKRNARLMGVEVNINSDGLRDQEYSLFKGSKRRVLFLGDSLTFGWGVSKEKTFEALLEKQLTNTEIINLGTGNYNTVQEVQLYLEKGQKYQPDELVVFAFINDAEPTPKKSQWSYLAHSQLLTFIWSQFRLRLGEDYQSYYRNLYKNDSLGFLKMKEAFIEIQAICQKQGTNLKIVLLPDLHQLSPYPFRDIHETLASFFKLHKMNYIDLQTKLQNAGPPSELWVGPQDTHPNAKAHALIAKELESFI